MPGYQAPKCFVTDGDPKGLITEFIQYLISISTKSSSLLRQQYTDVVEALKTARTLNNSESHQLAQILVYVQEGQQTESGEGEFEDDTRDIDLMASDNEDDEEEIESENEKDGAFLDDEREEQEDVSFYKRFHVELDRHTRQQRQELARYEDMLGQEQTSDHKVLIQ